MSIEHSLIENKNWGPNKLAGQSPCSSKYSMPEPVPGVQGELTDSGVAVKSYPPIILPGEGVKLS